MSLDILSGISNQFQNIASIGNTIGGFFGNSAADKARDDAWAKQKWLLDYNSPRNQRKRFEEAGINPFINNTGAFSTSMPSQPNVEPTRKASDDARSADTSSLNAFLEIMMLDKRKDLIDSQIALNRFNRSFVLPASVKRTEAETAASVGGESRANMMFPSLLEGAGLHNRKVEADTEQVKAQTRNTRAEYRKILNETTRIALQNFEQEMRNARLDERIQKELNEMEARIQAAALSGQASKIKWELDNMEKNLRNNTGASWHDSVILRRLQQYGAALGKQFGF